MTRTQANEGTARPAAERWVGRLAVAAVLVFCVRVFSDNQADVDLWGNVGFVRALPWSEDFRYDNTFSFTEPHTPWINHEWLGQYVLHHTHRTLGNTGLLALKILVGLGLTFLLHRPLKTDCRSGVVRFLYLLLVISTLGYGFSTRPHLFTYLMVALFLLLLKSSAARLWLPFLLALLGVVWANLHGAFFVGAVLLLVYAGLEALKLIPRADRQAHCAASILPVIACLLFLMATFVTPYGTDLWRFVFRSALCVRPYLSEWAPFSPVRHALTHPDFMVLALLSCIAFWSSRAPKDLSWTTLLHLSLIAAVLMRRNIPLFAIVAAFTVPRSLDATVGARVERMWAAVPKTLAAALLAIFIGATARCGLTFHKRHPLQIEIPEDRFPVETVAFMKAHGVSGNAVVFSDWAEYVIWWTYPQCQVFMDGRLFSAYGRKTVDDYLAFVYLGEEWRKALTDYPSDIVLVHAGNPVTRKMFALPDWQAVHQAGPAVLFLKREAHADALRRIAAGKAEPQWAAGPRLFP